MSASYCDFSRLGDSVNPGISAPYVGASSNVANPPFTMDHCTIDSSGELPYVGILDGSVNFQLTNDVWTNPVAAYALVAAASAALSGGGTRLVNNCLFYGEPDFAMPNGFTITDNYFGDIFYGGKVQPQWASFDGNLIYQPGGAEIQLAGNATNCFILANPANPSVNLNGLYMSGYADSTISGCVFQTTAAASEGTCISQTEGGVANRITTIANNIILPNGADELTGVLASMATNLTDTDWPTAVVDHNTMFVGGYSAAFAGIYTKPEMTGFVQSFESNCFWSNTPQSSSYALTTTENNPYSYPDAVSGADCDYNGWYNLATVPSGTWAAPDNGGNGTVYNIPLSSVPGVHDQANVNPEFADPTRNFQTWDAWMGGPGTVADGLALIEQNPSLTESSLLPYIRAGFAPTNPAYIGTAADGGTIGAVPGAVGSGSSAVRTSAAAAAAAAPIAGQSSSSSGLTLGMTTQVAMPSLSAGESRSTSAPVSRTVITGSRPAQERPPVGDVLFQFSSPRSRRHRGQSGQETGAEV